MKQAPADFASHSGRLTPASQVKGDTMRRLALWAGVCALMLPAWFMEAHTVPPQFEIVPAPISIMTDKMGTLGSLRVRLACNYTPCLTVPVTVQVRSDNVTQAWLRLPGGTFTSSVNLTFQSGTYDVDQTVEVQGRDDGQQIGDTPFNVILTASSSDTRINGLTKTVPGVTQDRTDYNVCIPNVLDQFWRLPTVLQKLPIRAGAGDMIEFDCLGYDNGGVALGCGSHFQGAARTKHGPHFVVTGNGDDWSQFYISKLASKEGLTGRWGDNFTTWDNDYQENYPGYHLISSTDKHAGSPAVFGDFLAIPLEGDSVGTDVWFYDVFDPARPTRIPQATLKRQPYEYAGAVAVTRYSGRYLVAVMSNNPPAIQFYQSNGGDIRQAQTWSSLGAWSTSGHGYPFATCFDNPGSDPTIQGMTFVQQCGGPLYLAVTYNDGWNGCNLGTGRNWMKVYEVNVPAILSGNANNSLTEGARRVFTCQTETLDYCNFAAGTSLYVSSPARQLLLYGAWYYRSWLATSLGPVPFIRAAEFADEDSPPGHTTLISKEHKPAIEDGRNFVGMEGPDTCPPLTSRCDPEHVNTLRHANIPINDIHYLRVLVHPGDAWNAGLPAPFVQVDDNTRAHAGSATWPYVFDVYPLPGQDPLYSATSTSGVPSWNAYLGTLRFVEQDDDGDNFGSTAYNGWPRSWPDWRTECIYRADGSADKNGLGVRFWATGTDLSPTSTAILRDASICFIDDSDSSITPYYRITVKRKSLNTPPALDPMSSWSVTEGNNLSFSVHGTDANDDTLTYSATGLPAGATLNATTGLFSWTPGFAQAGTYSITFSSSDGLAQASRSATVTVQNVNMPPVLTPIGNKTAYIGTVFNLQLSATDPDGGPLTYSVTPLPAGATINASTGLFSWNLSTNRTYASSYAVTFRVTDPIGLSDSETITIYVRTLTCFLGGTPVEMADGSTRPIEEVRPGDQVRTYDERTRRFAAGRVATVMTGSSAMHLVINGTLRLTDKHPLLVNGDWVEAGQVSVGDRLFRSDGTAEIVRSIDVVEREEKVYNFEVEGTHTYCAGGLVAHNKPSVGG